MSGVLELSFLILVLGAKGFTRAGMPFSAKRNITGKSAKILGALCVLLGLSGIGFAYWGSPPAGRRALVSVGQGILIGFVGAILAFGGMVRDRLQEHHPSSFEESAAEHEATLKPPPIPGLGTDDGPW